MAADFIAGLNGGVAGVLVGHPFDTVKIRLQTQDPLKPRYNGVFHCFALIARQETPLGLYKGMATPIVSVAFLASLAFGIQGFFLRRLDKRRLSHHYLSGLCTGAVRAFITCPIEVSKLMVQLQGIGQKGNTRLTYSGSVDAFFKILHAQGLRGIYRGFGFVLARDIPGFGLYFASFEWMCRRLKGDSARASLPIPSLILAGGFSGVSTWFFIYPMDVMKTRYQKARAAEGMRHLSYLKLIRRAYAAEGARVFSRGLSVALIRAFPVSGAIFTAVTLTKQVLTDTT